MSTPDPAWYRELTTGTGRAEWLGPDLRAALGVATADRAAEQVAVERARVAAALREQRRAERAERAAVIGRRVRDAFSAFWGRLLAGAVLVALTPAGASFATIMPIGDSIEPVVFFPGETGSVASSGPFTLYAILAWSTGLAIVALLSIDLSFGRPRSYLAWGGYGGALSGLGVFIWQWSENTLTSASWVIPPVLTVLGYGLHVVIDRARARVRGGVR